MGNLVGSPFNSMLVRYLRSWLNPNERTSFHMGNLNSKFFINKTTVLDTPQWWVIMKKMSVSFSEDLRFYTQPLSAECSDVEIYIDNLILTCEDLDYTFRVKGRITLFDVYLKFAFTPKYVRRFIITDINAKFQVDEIQSDLMVIINNVNHSTLANTLLNIGNPVLASSVLNAIFAFAKMYILHEVNQDISTLENIFSGNPSRATRNRNAEGK